MYFTVKFTLLFAHIMLLVYIGYERVVVLWPLFINKNIRIRIISISFIKNTL